jgi:hypothetical protein
MIILTTTRQQASFAKQSIFLYMNLWRSSQINNVKDYGKTTGEYLTVRLINCLLAEVEYLFEKKLLLTQGPKVNIKLSHAQGIAFYRLLLTLPADANNFYLQMIRNNWIEILDRQILKL